MNYLEHRLILAFFECGLCYNTVDVTIQLNDLVQLKPPTEKVHPEGGPYFRLFQKNNL